METKEFSSYWGFCRLCRHSISGSGGFFGKELNGANYCFTCYPKAVDIFLAEQRLEDYMSAKSSKNQGA